MLFLLKNLTSLKSTYNSNYYVPFVNQATRFNWIFQIEHNSQVKDFFIKFKENIETKLGRKIKAIQSYNGGEFLVLKPFLEKHDITHQWLCSHTHQQMGLEERRHKHAVDRSLTLLHHMSLHLDFWYFTFNAAVFLYNRTMIDCLVDDSPYSQLFKQEPNLTDLKSFVSGLSESKTHPTK